MPKVLIVGATGYIGKRLADALVQTGEHRVYGIARSAAKAAPLALNEVIPIISADPINDPSALVEAVRKYNIDVIVDTASAGPDAHKLLDTVKALGRERLQAQQAATGTQRAASKLGFLYCSGAWVHGSSSELVNDLDVVGTTAKNAPPKLVAWRVDLEKAVLASSDVLNVAVVRPTLIYGREGTIWTSFLLPVWNAAKSGSKDTVKIPLDPSARTGLVHVDDVATGFKAAIENLELINSGSVQPVFDLVTGQESMTAIFEAAARTWGFQGKVELVGAGDDLFSQAMSTTFQGSSARAKQLLGWKPTRLEGLVANIDVHAAAFASQH